MCIFPGKRINKEVGDYYYTKDSIVTVAPKGFTNEKIFLQWIVPFNRSILSSTTIPAIIIFDGFASY